MREYKTEVRLDKEEVSYATELQRELKLKSLPEVFRHLLNQHQRLRGDENYKKLTKALVE